MSSETLSIPDDVASTAASAADYGVRALQVIGLLVLTAVWSYMWVHQLNEAMRRTNPLVAAGTVLLMGAPLYFAYAYHRTTE